MAPRRIPIGPANRVTFVRAVFTGAVTVLVARRVRGERVRNVLTGLATGALALDAVDGWVARHTHSASAFGARFDGEADAVLIAALSPHAARRYGLWVLPAGAARYAFGMAGWVWPWLRRPLPYRYWRKVATATEGIALVAAASDLLPRRLVRAGLAVGSALIAESFGRDVVWLWRRREHCADAGSPV